MKLHQEPNSAQYIIKIDGSPKIIDFFPDDCVICLIRITHNNNLFAKTTINLGKHKIIDAELMIASSQFRSEKKIQIIDIKKEMEINRGDSFILNQITCNIQLVQLFVSKIQN